MRILLSFILLLLVACGKKPSPVDQSSQVNSNQQSMWLKAVSDLDQISASQILYSNPQIINSTIRFNVSNQATNGTALDYINYLYLAQLEAYILNSQNRNYNVSQASLSSIQQINSFSNFLSSSGGTMSPSYSNFLNQRFSTIFQQNSY